MRQTHHVTRQELMIDELPDARNFTEKHSTRAFRSKQRRGWTTTMPAAGPPFEMVAFVHTNHPLVNLVRRVREGQEWFDEDILNAELGGPWATFWVLPKLAKIGLAVVDNGNGEVRLRPADPRAARFVNYSRSQAGPKGYKIQRLIEAFLPVRDPRRGQLNVTENRRLALAEVLDEKWEIDAEDLFTDRRRVRLVSRWTVLKLIDAELEAV
jgi:hypothetical protein